MRIKQEKLLQDREVTEKNKKQASQRRMLTEKARKRLKEIERQSKENQ